MSRRFKKSYYSITRASAHKTKDGIRTVAPTGKFNTMLFSEEINNALKFGYKFKVLSGYTFDKANVFDNFVKSLYKIRTSYPKSNPMNLIAKLLMNSLYLPFRGPIIY